MVQQIIARESSCPDPAVPDYDRLMKAVVLCDGCGDGMVVSFVGGHLEIEIEQLSRNLADLGLDDAPEGISVWEGRFVYQRTPESYCGAVEYDVDVRGDFRDPTDEEWDAIRRGECPWDDSMYHRGPYCDAPVDYRVEGTINGRIVRYEVCEAHKHWPATRFDPGEELHATPIGETERSFGKYLRQKPRGCYAERDGWAEEWEAWAEAQKAIAVGEDADPA